jgi:outer membrane protein insertion porin family
MLGRRVRRPVFVGSFLLAFLQVVATPLSGQSDLEDADSHSNSLPAYLQPESSVDQAPAKGRPRILLAQQAGAQKNPSPFEEVPEAQGQQKTPPSPFEEVPEATPEGQRPPSPFEEVPDGEAKPTPITPRGDIIEAIQFRGTRRIPRENLQARIFSKPGDLVDGAILRRDYMVLWNTGYFDDLRLEIEDGEQGKVVRFVATERRMIRSIKYEGLKSATVSDVLERFKERRVGLSVESRYDPTRVQRAVVVLRELLGERGRQYAGVQPQVSQIPPSSIEVIFNVDEGPKVKVGNIRIEGNEAKSDKDVKKAMKNLHPMGIPHSLIFEKLFKKTFDIRKLEEDKERVRNMYQEAGHFKATVTQHELDTRDATGRSMFPLPFLFKRGGKRTDVTVHLDEGGRYQLGKLSFTDVALFRDPAILQRVFQMRDGDIFDIKKLREGLDNLKKLYGEFGYIDFVGEPNFEFRDAEDPPKVDLNLSVDEGKQFFVRRINFGGNSSTRDKVIRRELFVDEGDMFNTRVWDMSILRLNQLGYFEPLEEDEATEIRRDTRNGLVDLTLNVKERGKNTVSLNGGVSGFAGSFVGFGYATNNFLGLGETLSFDAQLGSRQRALTFGFTEPYLFDKPIQAGFTVFTSRFNFNQGREASIFSGSNLIPLFNQLGQDNFLDFRQNTQGFTTFMSYPLKRSFNRLSLTYRFQRDDLTTFSQSAENLFRFQNFLGVSGPNSLEGITTSEITPGFFHNTVNHPITPSGGKSVFASVAIAGIGGNTSFVQPTIEAKYFKSVGNRGHVIAMRFLGSILSGYGGKVPPPFRRAYMGGETDVRGFEIFGISPMVWIPDTTSVPILNDNGTLRTQNLIVDGVEAEVPQFTTVPIYRLSFPGGDTRMIYNLEYRIPLFGPVTLAPFFDVGFNKILLTNQVRMNQDRVAELNAMFPQAGIDRRIQVIPATQRTRASAGLELQVMMPVVQAPFRFYWAYNPRRVEEFLQPPIIADRSLFPNRTSFVQAISPFGRPLPFFEKQKIFRFTVSRTF